MPDVSFGGRTLTYNNPVVITFDEDSSSNLVKMSNASVPEISIIDSSGGVYDSSLAVFVDDDFFTSDLFEIKTSNDTVISDISNLNVNLRNTGVKFVGKQNEFTDGSQNINFRLLYKMDGDFNYDDEAINDSSVNSIFELSINRNYNDDLIKDISYSVTINESDFETPDSSVNLVINLFDLVSADVSNVVSSSNYTDFADKLTDGSLNIVINQHQKDGTEWQSNTDVSNNFTLLHSSTSGPVDANTQVAFNSGYQLYLKSTSPYLYNDNMEFSFELEDVNNNVASSNCKINIIVSKNETNNRFNPVELVYDISESDVSANYTLISNLKQAILDSTSNSFDSNLDTYTDYYLSISNDEVNIQFLSATIDTLTSDSGFTVSYQNGNYVTSSANLDANCQVKLSNTNQNAFTDGYVELSFNLYKGGSIIEKSASVLRVNIHQELDDRISLKNPVTDSELTNDDFITIDLSENESGNQHSFDLSTLFDEDKYNLNKDFSLNDCNVIFTELSNNSLYTNFSVDGVTVTENADVDASSVLVFDFSENYYNKEPTSSPYVGTLIRTDGDYIKLKFKKLSDDASESVEIKLRFVVERNPYNNPIDLNSGTRGFDFIDDNILRGVHNWPIGEKLASLISGNTSSLIDDDTYTDIMDNVSSSQTSGERYKDISGFTIILSTDASNAGIRFNNNLTELSNMDWDSMSELKLRVPNSAVPEGVNNVTYDISFLNSNYFEEGYTYQLNVFKSNASNERQQVVPKYEIRDDTNEIDITEELRQEIEDLNMGFTTIKFHNIRDNDVGDNIDKASLFFGDISSVLKVNGNDLTYDVSMIINVSDLNQNDNYVVYKPQKNYYRGYTLTGTDEYEHIAVLLEGSPTHPPAILDLQLDIQQTFTDYLVADAPDLSFTEVTGPADTIVDISLDETYLISDDIHDPEYNDLPRNEVKLVVTSVNIIANSAGGRGIEDICLNVIKFQAVTGGPRVDITRGNDVLADFSMNDLTSFRLEFNGGNHFFGDAELTYHFEPTDQRKQSMTQADIDEWGSSRSVTFTVHILPNFTDAPRREDLSFTCLQDSSFQLLNSEIYASYQRMNSRIHEDVNYSDYDLSNIEFSISTVNDTLSSTGNNFIGILDDASYNDAISMYQNFNSSLNSLRTAYESANNHYRAMDVSYLIASDNYWEMKRIGTNTQLSEALDAFSPIDTLHQDARGDLTTSLSNLQTKFIDYCNWINSLYINSEATATLLDLNSNSKRALFFPQPKFHGASTMEFQFIPVSPYQDNSSNVSTYTFNVTNVADPIRYEDSSGHLILGPSGEVEFTLTDYVISSDGYYRADIPNSVNSYYTFTIDPSDVGFTISGEAVTNNAQFTMEEMNDALNKIKYTAQGHLDSNEGLKTLTVTAHSVIGQDIVVSNDLKLRVLVQDEFQSLPSVTSLNHTCVEDTSLNIDISQIIQIAVPQSQQLGPVDFLADDYNITIDVSLGDTESTVALKDSTGAVLHTLFDGSSVTVALETLSSLHYVPDEHYYTGYLGSVDENLTFTITLKRTEHIGENPSVPNILPVVHTINVTQLYEDALHSQDRAIQLFNVLDEQSGIDLPIFDMYEDQNSGDIDDPRYTDFDTSGSVWVWVKDISYGDFNLQHNKGKQLNKSVFQWINISTGVVERNVSVNDQKRLSEWKIRFNTEIYDEYNGIDSITFAFSDVSTNSTSANPNNNNSRDATFTVTTDISGGNTKTLVGSSQENYITIIQGQSINIQPDILNVLSGATTYKVYHTRYGDSGVANSKDEPENKFSYNNSSLTNGMELNLGDDIYYQSTVDYYSGKIPEYLYNAPLGGFGRDTLTIRYVPSGETEPKFSSFVVNINKPTEKTVMLNEGDVSGDYNLSLLFDPNVPFKSVEPTEIERFRSLSEVEIEITDICNTSSFVTFSPDVSDATFEISGSNITPSNTTLYPSNSTLVFTFPENYYNYDMCGNNSPLDRPDFVKFRFVDNVEGKKIQSEEITVNFRVTRLLDDVAIIKVDEIIQQLSMDSSVNVNVFDTEYFYGNDYTVIDTIGDHRYSDYKIEDLDIMITDLLLNDSGNTLTFENVDISNTTNKIITNNRNLNSVFKYTPKAGFYSSYADNPNLIDYVKFKYVSKLDDTQLSEEVTLRFVVLNNDSIPVVNANTVTMNSNQYVEFNLNDVLGDNPEVNIVNVEFTSLDTGKLVNLTKYTSDATDIRGTILDPTSGVKSGTSNGYRIQDEYRYYPQIETSIDAKLYMKLYEIRNDANTGASNLTISIPVVKTFEVTGKSSV